MGLPPGAFQITFARSARKELEHLRDPLLSRIFRSIEALGRNPRPPGCRRLEGADDLWRVRVGDYRIVYSIDDARRLIDISAIRHRSDVYR
jgi:mRNA interferase RelE/StbE